MSSLIRAVIAVTVFPFFLLIALSAAILCAIAEAAYRSVRTVRP